jgi:hypothetical protein
MNMPSLFRKLRKRLFAPSTPKRKTFRRSPLLQLEPLEARELLSATPPPSLLGVRLFDPSTGATLSPGNTGSVDPSIAVQFNEAMDPQSVQDATNYVLFNSSGTQVSIASSSFRPFDTTTNTEIIDLGRADTTLVGSITSSQTAITVASTQGFPATGSFNLQIDAEIMLVTQVTGTTLTVQRGVDSTVPAIHNAGALAQATVSSPLPVGNYTLFLKGDHIFTADDTLALASQGQVVVANAGQSSTAVPPEPGPANVSTINLAPDGSLNTVESYPLGPSISPQTIPPNQQPLLVTVADFNGDGINDVAIVNNTLDANGNASVEIFQGEGNGQFASTPTQVLPIPGSPHIVNIIAFNESKFAKKPGADLALLDQANSDIVVFKNNTVSGGPLNFGAEATYASPVGGAHLNGLVADDFNNDGAVDLATANFNVDGKIGSGTATYDVYIFAGKGNGTFAPVANIIPVGFEFTFILPSGKTAVGFTGISQPTDLAAGELDGTGFDDIAVVGAGGYFAPADPAMEPLFNHTAQGSFQFDAGPLYFLPTVPDHIALGRIHDPTATVDDVITTQPGSANPTLTLFTNNGAGTFFTGAGFTLPLNESALSVTVAQLGPVDANGNPTGPDDILVPNYAHDGFDVIHNLAASPGAGFTVPPNFGRITYQVDNGPVALAVGGAGNSPNTNDAGSPVAVGGGDINGDGIPDVVTANIGVSGTVPQNANFTGSSFTVVHGAGPVPFSVANSGGTVLAAASFDATTYVEAGLTPPGLPVTPKIAAPGSIAVGDLNGMGVPDYVVADTVLPPEGGPAAGLNQVEIYLGTATAPGGPVTYGSSLADDIGGATKLVVTASTTLAAPVAPTDTTITVTSTAGFPTSGNFEISIDSETMLVTGVDAATSTFTVTRAVASTVAASHLSGAVVSQITISDSQTTIQVASTAGFPTNGGFTIQVDAETMLVTAVDPVTSTFTVTRGADGTTAVVHKRNALVTQTSIPLMAPLSFVLPGKTIQIDGETMLVTGVDPATGDLTVERGVGGTVTASHLIGAEVHIVDAISVSDTAGRGKSPLSVTLANLSGTFWPNGEPKLDIVTADNADNFVSILPNIGLDAAGAPIFGAPVLVPVGQAPTQVIAGLFKRADTTLSARVSATQTSITVTAAQDFPATGSFPIQVDSETMLVTAVSQTTDATGAAQTTLTVTRGVDGTTAAAHAVGAIILTEMATTLTAGTDNLQTGISVASTAGLPTTGDFRIQIGSEIMLVTAVDAATSTLKVVRGVAGTLATTHTAGAVVFQVKAADDLIVSHDSLISSGVTTLINSSPSSDLLHTFVTTLSGDIDNLMTTLTVADGSGFSVGNNIQIGSEIMLVTGVTGDTLTVQRAVGATTVAFHSNGALVQLVSSTILTAGVSSGQAQIAVASTAGFPQVPNATVLAADVDSSVTTITVASTANFPTATPFRIQIDSETMLVTAIMGGTTLQVERGVDGTVAAAHAAGANVQMDFVLAGAIDASQTLISVASAAGLPSTTPFRIQVDSETMLVTAVSGTTLTVTRGIDGTPAVAHVSGANVQAGFLVQVDSEIMLVTGMTTVTSNVTSPPTVTLVLDVARAVDGTVAATHASNALVQFVPFLVFLPASEVGNGMLATAVAAGDFNADGNLDFVFAAQGVGNGVPGTVTLMEGTGTGSFNQFGSPYQVGPNPGTVAVADVNGDGFPDVIVGSKFTNDPTQAISVLLNTVGFGFRQAVFSAMPSGVQINSLAVVDLPSLSSPTTTFLANDIDNSTQTVTISSATASGLFTGEGIPRTGNFRIQIDSEIMLVTQVAQTNLAGVTTITLTVARGVDSAPAPHKRGAVITVFSDVPDLYPDLVVSTSSNTSVDPNHPVVDNVYTLMGVGDGTFGTPVPYEAGGPPTPATVAVTSNPFMRLIAFVKGGDLVSNNLVENGSFNVRDLNNEAGNLVGWQTFAVQDSHGGWYTQTATSTGSFSPLSQVSVLPPDGQYQAMLDEADLAPSVSPLAATVDTPASYQGSNFLYQDITIPADAATARLSFRLVIDNFASSYAPISSLDYRSIQPNQQVRVDVMNPLAPLTTTTADSPGSPGVYYVRGSTNPIFVTDQSTPLMTTVTTGPIAVGNLLNPNDPANIDLLAAMPSLRGSTVRLRIAVVNNQGKLVVGVDDVHLQVTYIDAPGAAPALDPHAGPTLVGPPQLLRNPGFTSGPGMLLTTTDPTFIGQVSDDGGLGNVQFIAFDPNYVSPDPNNLNFTAQHKQLVETNVFDAQGNFSVTLPDLNSGANTIGVLVRDFAGNTFTTTITFDYEGPNRSNFSAAGPGPIATTSEANITYTTVSGRVTAVATDPTDPSGNTYLVGSANGGVWRTTDGGNSWTPLTDHLTNGSGQPINTPIGAIAFSPNAPAIVYAATGVGDILPDSRGSVGILVSYAGGQPGSWSVLANTDTVFANARITTVAVARKAISTLTAAVNKTQTTITVASTLNLPKPGSLLQIDSEIMLLTARSGTTLTVQRGADGTVAVAHLKGAVVGPPDQIYVAVAGSLPGTTPVVDPGVYRSLNGGQSWTNILTLSSLNIPATDPLGNALTAPSSIASVTSLVIDPRDTHNVTIGLGNIGLAPDSTSAGVWTSSNADSVMNAKNPGPSWIPLLGDDANKNVPGTIPNDSLPSDLRDAAGAAVTIGRVTVGEGFASPSTGPGSNIATFYVLMGTPPASPPLTGGSVNYGSELGLFKSSDGGLNFTKVILTANTGTIASPNFQNINLLGNDASNVGQIVVDPTDPNVIYVGGADNQNPNAATPPPAVGLVRVDTGDMRDTTYVDPTTGKIPNDGSDIVKALKGAGAEGVSWYDLESNRYSPASEPTPTVPTANAGFAVSAVSRLPAEVQALALDADGRLVIGTQEGVWRAVYHGVGYDFTSGGLGLLGPSHPTPAVSITTINGNLQISNLTSVASDPQVAGQYFASAYDTGTMMTTGGLNWQTMGLNGPATGAKPDSTTDAGVVLVAAPDPTAPSDSPTTVYRDFAYTVLNGGYFPETNTQNGAIAKWLPVKSAGISGADAAGYFPVLAIDPTKIFNSGVYQDLLLFGTDRIYETLTSANLWQDKVGHPLSTLGGVISAAAVAPSNINVLYAGTDMGEVFVTLNGGQDNWPGGVISRTLPAGTPVTSITVDPSNARHAYVTVGGTGSYSHVWQTNNAGVTWTPLAGTTAANRLPRSVPVYSLVTDTQNGHLYLGTEVGLFVSIDQGATWTTFGNGSVPNVPVVKLDFNQNLGLLTVATQGRGAFVIATNAPEVISFTPTTTQTSLSSVTVTFNKGISKFPASQVIITGPGGVIIPAMPPKDITQLGQPPHTTWEIDFAKQLAGGTYTFKIGPNVFDFIGQPMDQNQNSEASIDNSPDGGDSFTFKVLVKGALKPTVSHISDQVISVGGSRTINFTVGDKQNGVAALQVTATSDNPSLIASPLALTLNGSAGTLMISPTPGIAGIANITLVVTDPIDNLSTTEVFKVTVDTPPTITPTPVPNQTGAVGSTFTINNLVVTPNASNVTVNTTFKASTKAPIQFTYTNPTLTITPPATFVGTFTVTIVAQDTVGGVNVGSPTTEHFTVTLTSVATSNLTLSVKSPAPVSHDAGSLSVPVSATFSSGAPLTFDAFLTNGLPAGVVVTPPASGTGPTASGVITISNFGNFAGTFSVTATVTSGSATVTKTFLVTITDRAPTFTTAPPKKVTVPHTLGSTSFNYAVTDAEGDPITVTAALSGLPAGTGITATVVTSGGNTGQVQITGFSNFAGTFTVTTTASDGIRSTSRNTTVTVTAPKPIFSLSNITVPHGPGQTTVNLTATDPEDLQVTYTASLTGAPAGVTVNNVTSNAVTPGGITTGQLTISGYSAFAGKFTLTVKASDGITATTRTVTVTITNVPPKLAPISNVSISQGTQGQVTLNASDADGDPLTFSYQAISFNPLYSLQQRLQLTNYEQFFDLYGHQEYWLKSSTNGGWYALLPSGNLYVGNFNDAAEPFGALVADVGVAVYNNLNLLLNASPPEPVTVNFSLSGNILTFTPPSNFTGTFEVIVSVSDGVVSTSRTFLVTVS